MSFRTNVWLSVAPICLLAAWGSAATAGEITGFTGISGAGYVFSDPTEGVYPPGIKAVTNVTNNDDYTSANGFSPSPVTGQIYNCLMANNSSTCDAAAGTGKRIKTNVTGREGFDLSFSSTPTSGTTEYFTFGKITNRTGARVLGYSFQLGTGTGSNFAPTDGTSGIAFDQLVALSAKAAAWPGLGGATTGQNPLQRAFYPDGLFGDGGQEGTIGFFSDQSAGMVVLQSADNTTMTLGSLFNTEHLALFGNGMLDRSQIPLGMFWDTDGNAATEAAVVAWFNTGANAWQYGNLAAAANLSAELDKLAAALGVQVADLNYVSGGAVPADIIAKMTALPAAFEAVGIEDISNLNLNFSLDVGDLAAGTFTLRVIPVFAPIVSLTGTNYQFSVAASIDAANIPYLNADPAYTAMISSILALPTVAEQQLALERLGYSYLSAYPRLGKTMAGSQIFALSPGLDTFGNSDNTTRLSTSGSNLAHGGKLFLTMNGGAGSVDSSTNTIGYDFNNRNISAGYERNLTPQATIGFAIGHSTADATIYDSRGSLDASGVSAAVFSKGNFGKSGRFYAIAGYQDLSFDSTRQINAAGTIATAVGHTSGETLFAGVQGDWMLKTGSFSYGPMGSAEFYHTKVNAFTESGAGAFNIAVGDQNEDTFVAKVGMSGSLEVGTFRPYGHIAYATQSGSDYTVSTSFGGVLPGNTPVDGLDKNWVDVGLGVSAQLSQGMRSSTSLNLDYQGKFGAHSKSNNARLLIKIIF